jgi:hypothetical protein
MKPPCSDELIYNHYQFVSMMDTDNGTGIQNLVETQIYGDLTNPL